MGFAAVKYVQGMFEGPAATDIEGRTLYIARDWWDTLSDDLRRMVYLHEEGHLMLNTTDEEQADAYAFEHYAAEGRSLKTSVRSLSDLLINEGPEKEGRVNARILQAMYYDWQKNKNPEAKQYLEQNNLIPMCSKCNNPGHTSDMKLVGFSFMNDVVHKALVLPAIMDRIGKNQDAKQARIDKQNDADIKLKLDSGISFNDPQPSPGAGGFSGGGFFGGNNNPPPPPPPANNTTTYIIVGVVVVIVIAAVAFFKLKK